MREPRPTALGRLELAVLDRLWAHGPADVNAMQRAVGDPRGLVRNTIQSTLERLVRKELAERRKAGRAYVYRARISRAEWVARTLSGLLDSIPGADSQLMISAFVDLTERTGERGLDELEELVRRRRREREGKR